MFFSNTTNVKLNVANAKPDATNTKSNAANAKPNATHAKPNVANAKPNATHAKLNVANATTDFFGLISPPCASPIAGCSGFYNTAQNIRFPTKSGKVIRQGLG